MIKIFCDDNSLELDVKGSKTEIISDIVYALREICKQVNDDSFKEVLKEEIQMLL